MSPSATPARATLDAWRKQHADRLDPVRFHFMDALERRAAAHDGDVRRLLDARLSELIEAYGRDLGTRAPYVGETAAPQVAKSALAALVEQIAQGAAARNGNDEPDDAAPLPSSYPQLEALDAFRKLWGRLRTEDQLRQSLEHVPTNAGPLNSGALVHRSIALMQELSPGYLQHFLAYVDNLAWMDQIGGVTLPTKDEPQPANSRKRTRKPRTKRDTGNSEGQPA